MTTKEKNFTDNFYENKGLKRLGYTNRKIIMIIFLGLISSLASVVLILHELRITVNGASINIELRENK